jgi:hypothetical protein
VEIRTDYIGNARSPVAIIENCWPDPRALADVAASRSDYVARSLYYPGVRSSAPVDYAQALVRQLGDVIRDTFGVSGELEITDSTFSLVATPPDKLVGFQRVPHFDSTDPNRIAVLHYLCGPDQGGTAFYRHRSSGTEVVTETNREPYIRQVNAEVKAGGMPLPGFIDDDTPLFERIARYDCVFNRVLIYRGHFLHSVNVGRAFIPTGDPRSGRLTVNTFLLGRAGQSPVQ